MEINEKNIAIIVSLSTIVQITLSSLGKLFGWLWGLIVARFNKEKESVDLKKDVSEIKSNLKIIADKINSLGDKLNRVKEFLINFGYRKFFQSESPLRLSKPGEKLLTDIKADKYLENDFDKLLQIIKETKPTNAYDVQEECKNIFEKKKVSGELKVFEPYAYEKGIPLEVIATAMALKLRDMVFRHPDFEHFDAKDIDKIERIKREKHI